MSANINFSTVIQLGITLTAFSTDVETLKSQINSSSPNLTDKIKSKKIKDLLDLREKFLIVTSSSKKELSSGLQRTIDKLNRTWEEVFNHCLERKVCLQLSKLDELIPQENCSLSELYMKQNKLNIKASKYEIQKQKFDKKYTDNRINVEDSNFSLLLELDIKLKNTQKKIQNEIASKKKKINDCNTLIKYLREGNVDSAQDCFNTLPEPFRKIIATSLLKITYLTPQLMKHCLQNTVLTNHRKIEVIQETLNNLEGSQTPPSSISTTSSAPINWFNLLPQEIQLEVLYFLQPRDLLNFSQTCKKWQDLANMAVLWKRLWEVKCREFALDPTFYGLGKQGLVEYHTALKTLNTNAFLSSKIEGASISQRSLVKLRLPLAKGTMLFVMNTNDIILIDLIKKTTTFKSFEGVEITAICKHGNSIFVAYTDKVVEIALSNLKNQTASSLTILNTFEIKDTCQLQVSANFLCSNPDKSREIHIWDIETNRHFVTISLQKPLVFMKIIHSVLFTTDELGNVQKWKLQKGKSPESIFSTALELQVNTIDTNGRYLCAIDATPVSSITVIDFNAPNKIRSIPVDTSIQSIPIFQVDGHTLYALCDSQIHVFDIESGKMISTIKDYRITHFIKSGSFIGYYAQSKRTSTEHNFGKSIDLASTEYDKLLRQAECWDMHSYLDAVTLLTTLPNDVKDRFSKFILIKYSIAFDDFLKPAVSHNSNSKSNILHNFLLWEMIGLFKANRKSLALSLYNRLPTALQKEICRSPDKLTIPEWIELLRNYLNVTVIAQLGE